MRAYYIKRYCLADYLRGFFCFKGGRKGDAFMQENQAHTIKKPANNRIGSKSSRYWGF